MTADSLKLTQCLYHTAYLEQGNTHGGDMDPQKSGQWPLFCEIGLQPLFQKGQQLLLCKQLEDLTRRRH